MSVKKVDRAGISVFGELGVKMAAEVARIRGGLPSAMIDLGLLDEIVGQLVSGQFEDAEEVKR